MRSDTSLILKRERSLSRATRSSLSILDMVSTLPIRRSYVLNIPVVHTSILTLHMESCLGLACLNDKVIIAVRAVFVTEIKN